MVNTTRSADGTTIAYQRRGDGPALVLVVGAFCNRHTTNELAALLQDSFAVYEYDRRGRGDSGDTPPYVPQREVEDLTAVIDAAGGSASLFGHSSGAILALETAATGRGVNAVVAYEPPYRRLGSDVTSRIRQLIAKDDRTEAMRVFMVDAVGVPQQAVASIESWPDFAGMSAIAHTLPYDLTLAGDGTVPVERFSTIAVPVLIADGERTAWSAEACDPVADAIPNAERTTLAGQDHGAAPSLVAPMVTEFLTPHGLAEARGGSPA